MRKEVLFAIIAGSLLGLVVAFGIWRANIALKGNTQTEVAQESKEENKNPSSVGLTISSPNEFEVVTSSKVTVKGISNPNSIIVISGESKDYFATSGADGAFEKEITLIGGLNNLNLTSFDPDDGSTQKELPLVYSSEFAKFLESDDATQTTEATGEADAIRQKVLEKLSSAKKVSRAYVGTLTDITKETFQIKDAKGEILQVAISQDETEFVRVGKETKTINQDEVAIGDFIVAMGLKNGNGVLAGKRILVTQTPEKSTIKPILGTIESIEKKAVTVKTNDGTTWTANFGKSWDGPELKEIVEGEKIIVVGETSENKLTVRTLYLVSNPTPKPKPVPSPSPQASP